MKGGKDCGWEACGQGKEDGMRETSGASGKKQGRQKRRERRNKKKVEQKEVDRVCRSSLSFSSADSHERNCLRLPN